MDQGQKSNSRSEIGSRHEVPLVGSVLVQQGIITDEEYASALSRSEQSGHSIWTALRGTRLVLPDRKRGAGGAEPSNEEMPRGTTIAGDDQDRGTPVAFGNFDVSRPIPALVSGLFEDATRWGATDLHFDPTPDGVRVRARIDGLLHDVGSLPDDVAQHVRARIKVLAGMDLLEKREPQDGHVTLQGEAGHRDFRVATLLTGLGERMVVRSHQMAEQGHTLDVLGLEDDQVAAVRRLLSRPHGLILVAGPTGSGKTTTLYACLRELATPVRSLLTIEDPIEYRLDGVTQVEVHRDLGLNFARGLRAILRQDPDVIMVGEIRDRQTARIASRAAAAGTFVLSTAHAADGFGVLRTLANYQVPPQRIGESLGGIIVQRLVRTLCECKRPLAPERAPRTTLAGWGLGDDECGRANLYEPAGCPRCLWTGFRGRTGIFEVIELDEPLGRRGGLARDGSRWSAAIAEGRSCDLAHAAARKVAAGTTTVEEVRRLIALPRRDPGDPPQAPGAEHGILENP